MHELPIVKSIFDICAKHAMANNAKKVLSITLKVGELSHLEDQWIQRYFDYLSKSTFVEGAKLVIERVPLVLRCKLCSESFHPDIHESRQIECPRCKGTEFDLISGREYEIYDMEIA